MIIEELKIGKFAGFENKTFNFSKGINLIEGENESGKSSIAEFIRFIFYGVKEEDKGKISSAFGYLVLSCGKGRFRIERSFTCGGGQIDERVTIVDLQINAPLKGRDPAAMFLRVPERIFERSCFFSQFGTRDVGGEALASALENMLSSADEQINAEKSARDLEKKIAFLKGEGEENPLSLDALLKEKEALSLRHEKACGMEEDYRRIKESYLENKKKAEGNKKALEECRALLGHSDALLRLERIKRANEAKAQLEGCQKTLREHRLALTERDFLPDGAYLKSLQSLSAKGSRFEETVNEKEGEIASLKEELASIPLPEGGKEGALLEKVAQASAAVQKNQMYFVASAVLFAVLLLFALLFAILSVAPAAVIAALLALAAGGAGGFFFRCKKQSKAKENALYALAGAENREELTRAVEEWARRTERRAGLEKQIEDAARKMEKAKEGRDGVLAEGAELAARWGKSFTGVKALEQLAKKTAAVIAHLEGLENEEKQARITYSDLQVDYTAEELNTLVETVKAQSGREALSPEEYKKITMKVNFYDQTSRALDDRTAKQAEQLARLEETMEDRHALAHSLCVLEERIERTTERIRVLTLAKDAILLALTRMREKILPGILEDASAFLAQASGGRYTALVADEHFALSVRVGDSEETLPAEKLSAAMGDLAYIALRMAVSARLYGEEPAILVFDESFTHLDDVRLASLFMALAKKAGEKDLQIFFMTCRKREAALFERVTDLHKITLPSRA
jgi:uncharacterized protein YhaN